MLRDAAGHHGVDSDALNGGPPAQGRQLGDKLIAVAPGVRDKAAHQFLGWRDDGQASVQPVSNINSMA